MPRGQTLKDAILFSSSSETGESSLPWKILRTAIIPKGWHQMEERPEGIFWNDEHIFCLGGEVGFQEC